MGVFFKKQSKVYFSNQEEVIKYWMEEGAQHLDEASVDDMIDLMIDDLTFKILTEFYSNNLIIKPDNLRILDAGCGWGRSLFGLKRKFPEITITGVDVTEPLLDLGNNISKKLKINGIVWEKGNLLQLDYNDNHFDSIISTRVLHYIVEPKKVINELLRVLRPGGRMIIIVPNKYNPLIYFKYHTQVYSSSEISNWFPPNQIKNFRIGSMGFIPPFKYLRKFNKLVIIEKIMRKIPILNKMGGLAYCLIDKKG